MDKDNVTHIKVEVYDPQFRRRNDEVRLDSRVDYQNTILDYLRVLKWDVDTSYITPEFYATVYSTSVVYYTWWYRILQYVCPNTLLLWSVKAHQFFISPETGRDSGAYLDTNIQFRLDIVNMYKAHYTRNFTVSIVDLFVLLFLHIAGCFGF